MVLPRARWSLTSCFFEKMHAPIAVELSAYHLFF
jgi:hypothetical protein